MLHDIRVRVFSVFNHACVSADATQCMFRQLMCKIADLSDKDKDVPFVKDFTDKEYLSVVND